MSDVMEKFGTDRGNARSGRGHPVSKAVAGRARELVVRAALNGERRWMSDGDAFWHAQLTMDRLPSGLYRCAQTDFGPTLVTMRNDTDELVDLPDSPSAEVIEEIRHFWTLSEAFASRGFLHKRGVLLCGPPGSGKTATIQQLIRMVVNDHDGIAVFVDSASLAGRCLQVARRIEPDRPIVALIEDLDALVAEHGEGEYLALLDGEAQVNNIVFVGTTNYPERLDRRFVDRPSRFDLIREIGMPSPAARLCYLRHKVPDMREDELARWVRRSDGYSLAHLREMIVLCCCYGKTLDAAVDRLDRMRESRPSSDRIDDGRRSSVGFRPGSGSTKEASMDDVFGHAGTSPHV